MNALNRTTVVLLTNKSGGAVARGDVVILDSTTASAFTTTTSAALATDMIGVVVDAAGIAANAQGMIALMGYVGQVNLSASASLGDTFGTHSAAKQAAPHSAVAIGDFGQVLGTGTTPAAMLWGQATQYVGGVSTPLSRVTSFSPYASFANTDTACHATINADGTLVLWSIAAYVSSTNNASHYWNITLNRMDTGAVLATLSTSAVGPGAHNRFSTGAISIPVTTSMVSLYINVVKVGSPGAIIPSGPSFDIQY